MGKHELDLVEAIVEIANKKPTNILDAMKIVMGHCSDNIKSITLKGERKVRVNENRSDNRSQS